MPGITGCIQATEAIKYIVGFGESLSGRMLNIDLATHDYEIVSVPRNSSCPACGGRQDKVGDLPSDAACAVDIQPQTKKKDIPIISANDLRKKISSGDTVLIDVRDNFEFTYCHLPSSISIPMSTMKKADSDGNYLKQVLERANGKQVVFYCKSGVRSLNVLETLKPSLDQENISSASLDGGVLQWQRENPDFLVL